MLEPYVNNYRIYYKNSIKLCNDMFNKNLQKLSITVKPVYTENLLWKVNGINRYLIYTG